DGTDADLPVDSDARRFVVRAFDRQVLFSSASKKKADSGCPGTRVTSSVVGHPSSVVTDDGQLMTDNVPRTLEHSPTPGEAAGEARAAPAYHIVGRKLARKNLLHKSEALLVATQPARSNGGVMLEYQQPPFRLGARVQPALRLERHQGLEVVAHDPGEGQVGRRGHQ